MPVPSSIDDLSTTASSNSPSGGETPKDGDNYIRALSGFIATLRDKLNGTSNTGTVKAATFTGTHTFSSGNLYTATYTPTLSSVGNASGLSVAAAWLYVQVGGIVAVSGEFTSSASSVGATSIGVTLPVSTTFATAQQAIGTATRRATAAYEAGYVWSEALGSSAIVTFNTADTGSRVNSVLFFYRVI